MSDFDPYVQLGVQTSANQQEIDRAYRRRRAEIIADPGLEDGDKELALVKLDDAFATLTDAGQRAAYDRNAKNRALIIQDQATPSVVLPDTPTPMLQRHCIVCGGLVPVQATHCHHCRQQTARSCPYCGHIVGLQDRACPRCNTLIEQYQQRQLMHVLSVEKTVKAERIEREHEQQMLEVQNAARAQRIRVLRSTVVILIILLTVFYFIMIQ